MDYALFVIAFLRAFWALLASVDVTEQPPTEALERLGLHLSAETETV